MDIHKVSESHYKFSYNREILTESEAKELIVSDGAYLKENQEILCRTSDVESFIANCSDRKIFARKTSPSKWWKRIFGRWMTASETYFETACAIRDIGLYTPRPIFTGYDLRSESYSSFFVREYLDDAIELDDAIFHFEGRTKVQLLKAFAYFVAEIYSKGIYNCHLCSRNVLAQPDEKVQFSFWVVDLDKRHKVWGSYRKTYVKFLARLTFGFYDKLNMDDQNFFLNQCFDAALKNNIYSRPSYLSQFNKSFKRAINRKN